MSSPLLLAAIVGGLVFFPVLGNLRPDLVSFLPSMRQYAGNCASATWAFAPGAEAKLDNIARPAGNMVDQVADTYPRPVAKMLLTMPLAWRALLIEAIQTRCHVECGEFIVAWVESQPIHKDCQQYKVIDGALGVIESGSDKVADSVDQQPWPPNGPIPLQVTRTGRRGGEPTDTTDAVVATVAHERPPAGTRAV